MGNRTCSVDGCERPATKRGWCDSHYSAWRRKGTPTSPRKNAKKPCSIDGCDRPTFGYGWCATHYMRWKKYGDTSFVKVIKGDTVRRFWSNVNQDGPVPVYAPHLGPCWLWRGRPEANGYGVLKVDGKSRKAHRYSYELLVGPIPEGLEIDHLCRVKNCVRYTHLEAVPPLENQRRAAEARRAAKRSA